MRVDIYLCPQCGAVLTGTRFEQHARLCRPCDAATLPPLTRPDPTAIESYQPWRTKRLNSAIFFCYGKKYETCGHHFRLRSFLESVVVFCQWERIGFRPVSLMRFRRDFRRIIRQGPVPSLIWCLQYGEPGIRQLVIWLLGRIRNRHTANVIFRKGRTSHPEIRKEAAKALRRMGAWQPLRELGEAEQHPRVLAYIKEPETPEFSNRLDRFVENVRRIGPVGKDRMNVIQDLVMPCPLDQGTPPKPEWAIGKILQRIRCFVMKGIPASVARIRYRRQ